MPPPPPPPAPAPPPVSSAPPQLDKSAAKGRNAMLNDITKFKAGKLKKTVTNDRSAPAVASK